jgi:hypothetical protein
MDSNKDGSLSREGFQIFTNFCLSSNHLIFIIIEFSEFGTDFFLGTSPRSPSRFFFGPLILDY